MIRVAAASCHHAHLAPKLPSQKCLRFSLQKVFMVGEMSCLQARKVLKVAIKSIRKVSYKCINPKLLKYDFFCPSDLIPNGHRAKFAWYKEKWKYFYEGS